ncbi:hypothetical protein ACSSWA_06535 [Melioribacter sp. Ez-97]|uniref:hypothetical protein n=1 Tax=Melioribacter sp. Ez-97 TaxID=3423434 RepID=UPI003ED8ADC5
MTNSEKNIDALEKQWIYAILPEDKPGYNSIRNKIENSIVLKRQTLSGDPVQGSYKLILAPAGYDGNNPDTYSTTPISTGRIKYDNAEVYITISSYEDDVFEVEIAKDMSEGSPGKLLSVETYAAWEPGMKAPFDNSDVREIEAVKNKYTLAVAPVLKRIWLYEYETGINYLIPLSNFFNELMRSRKIQYPEIVSNPNYLFANLDKFEDADFIRALYFYNKYIRRLDLQLELKEKPERKSLFGLFSLLKTKKR